MFGDDVFFEKVKSLFVCCVWYVNVIDWKYLGEVKLFVVGKEI